MPIRLLHGKFPVILILLLSQDAFALGCPNGELKSCLLGSCTCLPKIKGEHNAIEETGNALIVQTAGAVSQEWLTTSRNTAIGNAQPILPQIRSALSGYIDQETMNRVRFKIGDNNQISPANLSINFGDKVYAMKSRR